MVKHQRRIQNDYEVGAVRKALAILCLFNPETPSLTVTEVGRQLKLPKSTAFNLLRTLQSFDFVTKDSVTKHYQLGRKTFELGALFSRRNTLVACALPHLRRLSDRTKETVKLGILADAAVLVIAAVESPLILHTRGDEGRLAPLYCTSAGKALLALATKEEMRGLIAKGGLRPFTARTVTTLAQLEEEVEQIRMKGYAVDWEEHEEGVRCIGAPVIGGGGNERASISLSGPASRFTKERIPEIAALVVETAKEISAALGNEEKHSCWSG